LPSSVREVRAARYYPYGGYYPYEGYWGTGLLLPALLYQGVNCFSNHRAHTAETALLSFFQGQLQERLVLISVDVERVSLFHDALMRRSTPYGGYYPYGGTGGACETQVSRGGTGLGWESSLGSVGPLYPGKNAELPRNSFIIASTLSCFFFMDLAGFLSR
jgi:hypothetical protein